MKTRTLKKRAAMTARADRRALRRTDPRKILAGFDQLVTAAVRVGQAIIDSLYRLGELLWRATSALGLLPSAGAS